MKINEVKNAINSYTKLVRDNESVEEIKSLFKSADLAVFQSQNFATLDKGFYYLHLGIVSDNLIGVLVSKEGDCDSWSDDTDFLNVSFISSEEYNVTDYSDKFVNGIEEDSEVYISPIVAANRIANWHSNKMEWVDECLSEGADNVVELFEIPYITLSNNQLNVMSLGINNDNGFIDLITENPSGLADCVRPVPPFKPGW